MNLKSRNYLVDNFKNVSENIFYNILKPDSWFIGREKYLDLINDKLFDKQCLIIKGLSGVGKTQLVLKYIDNYQNDFTHILFINAESFINILNSFREAFKIEYFDNPMNYTKKWTNRCKNWLIVYDNFLEEDIDLLKSFIPELENGYVIITTSNEKFNSGYEEIYVESFTENEAVEYLNKFTEIKDEERVNDIAKKLECFPYSLKVAASYMLINKISYLEFGNLFEKFINLKDFNDIKDFKPKSVFIVLSMSLNKIGSVELLQYLYIISYLSNYIDTELLINNKKYLTNELKEILLNKNSLTKLNSKLKYYSLIDINSSKISINNVARKVINYLSNDKEMIRFIIWFLGKIFLDNSFEKLKISEKYNILNKLYFVLKISTKSGMLLKKCSYLYNNIGSFFVRIGLVNLSEYLFENVLKILKNDIEFDFAYATYYLGLLSQRKNNFEIAEKLLIDSLDRFVNLNSTDNKYIINNLLTLSDVYLNLNKESHAIELAQRALDLYKFSKFEDFNYLFEYLEELMKYNYSKDIIEEYENIKEYSNLKELENIGKLFFILKEYEKSKLIYEFVISTLNNDYYNYIFDRMIINSRLADVYKKLNKKDETVKVLERIVEENHILNEESKFIIDIHTRLANMYEENSELNKTIYLYTKNVEICENIFQDKSVELVENLKVLFDIYKDKENYSKMESILLRIEDIYTDMENIENRECRRILKELINLYYKIDKKEKAYIFYEKYKTFLCF